MEDGVRKQPSDQQLCETYQKAIKDGRELHSQVVSFLIREPSQGLIQEHYDIESGIFRRPPVYVDELAAYIDKHPRFVDVSSRGSTDNAAYIHHVSGNMGVLLIYDIDKTRYINIWASVLAFCLRSNRCVS